MAEKIPRYVDVAVPLPVRSCFTYRVPQGLAGCSEAGARAVVPVGRRLLTGVIVGGPEEAAVDEGRIREVADLPDEAPVVPPELLALALWAARYYVAPPGAMLSAALPPGIGRRSEVVVSRVGFDPPEGGALSPEDRRILEALPEKGGAPARRLGASPARLERLERRGLIRREVLLRPARVKGKTAARARWAGGDAAAAREGCARAPRQREAIDLIASRGDVGIALEEARDRLGRAGPAAVAALARKGLVRIERVAVRRAPRVADGTGPAAPRHPTPDQAAALGELDGALESDRFASFLLMGVTGSGKTEVYLRAIERCLQRGRGALYLVPEIALTPLLARALRSRLGERLAILHSSLGPGERFDEWRRALSGEARVVLGARSAVLAPVERLGLVIVDEEQDGSYKQDEDPRYNARDLAILRGREARATVVLGSATPSIESFHGAETGRHRLLRLPRRILERPMANVRVIDMREEFARTGREDLVSEPLREAIGRRLARGEQAILLLNRRGYAPFVLCRSCGASERCRRCSVALTYHRAAERMRCHYCGYQRGRPSICSTCGSEKLVLAGAGTERLQEHLGDLFPEARMARLDRDTARGRLAPAEILSAFEEGRFNLLVGTQMVAKGHDFPGVTIVGVIGADNVLALPEFRSAERTFQLLTQVAGRAGRGDEPGEVIVQAFHREHYAIEAAARQDYAVFYEKERRYRRIMKYPPFTCMANLLVQADSPETGVRRARLVAQVLGGVEGNGQTVLGPAVAPIARLKGRYRYQVLVKSDSRRRLSDTLNDAARELARKGLASSRDLVIDIDPVRLL